MNRLKTFSDATGYIFTYDYDLAGNKIKETNAKNSTLTYSYDKLNRLGTTTDPFGIVISKREYDANGNMVKDTDAKGNPKLYSYDMAGRLIKSTSGEGNETKYEYNHYGEKTKVIDGLGNPTIYEYDSVGRLLKVIDANGIKTTYTYDLSGNKLYMTEGRGKTTSYVYGAFGKLRSVKDSEGVAILYQYDLEGNLVNKTDKNGYHIRFVYDSRKLLLEKEVEETGDRITYSYDSTGNKTGMSDASGDTTYIYDANNRLTEVSKTGQTQLNYIYDQIGNILKVTDSAGNTTAYTYDKASRMETVTFDGGKLTYQYDENGNRSSLTYSSGVKEEYKYNKDNEIISLVNKKASGEEISRYLYTYDGAGNRIAVNEIYKSLQPSGFIDDATGNDVQYILKKTDYTYSNAGKLLKLVERMYDGSDKEVLRKTVNYYYDANGNELSNTASWTHPHSIKLRQSTKGAVYADNMENETDSLIDRVNNTFDGFGRLVKIERISAGVRSESTFIYNGDNLRVSKTVKKSTNGYKAVVTNYLYDRQNVILETDENNAVKTRYVKGINYIASISAGNATSYFLFNGHGDVVQTVDKDGEVRNNYDYDIWGNPTLTVETAECAIRYAGEFYDSETGLYYLRARYYNPYIGRFISEDSYWGEDNNPLSLNRYSYAHNDPIQYLDPTGHAVVTKAVLSAVAVGAIKGIASKIASTTKAATATKTETTTKQVINDSLLKAVGIVGNQSLTVSKAVSAVKNSSDMEKAISMGSATKVKTDDIKEKMMQILTKSYENTVYNMSNVQAKGGTVQTVFKGKAVMTTQNAFLAANSGQKEFKVDNLFLETTATKGMKRFAKNVLKGNAQYYGNYYKNAEMQRLAYTTEGDSSGRYKRKGEDSTWLQGLLDDADKSLNSWLIAHGFGGTDVYGAKALWMSEDEYGVYHAKTNAWQQIGGYNHFYDEAFDYGTSMDAKFFDFAYDERKFRVWSWKGDYINLGAGAEIGIYSKTSGILGLVDVKSPFEDHWLVDTNLAMPMTLNLMDNEKHVISDYKPTEKQWWITSFNPSYKDVEASNLTATYTMTFSTDEYHKGMYEAFREEWEGMNDNLTFDNYSIRFVF